MGSHVERLQYFLRRLGNVSSSRIVQLRVQCESSNVEQHVVSTQRYRIPLSELSPVVASAARLRRGKLVRSGWLGAHRRGRECWSRGTTDDGEADGSEGGALVGDEVRGPVGVVLVGEGEGA